MSLIRKLLPLLLLLIGIAADASVTPRREVRAAVIRTDRGIDWPRGRVLMTSQQEAMRSLLRQLSDGGFNTVYLQVEASGTLLWTSDFLGRSPELAPDYDAVQFVLDECRYLGLSCHAMVDVLDLGTGGTMNPEYLVGYKARRYLDPGNPDARDYAISIYRELLTRYDFDGLLLASLHYPTAETAAFDDANSYYNYNPDYLPRDQWRRTRLDLFAYELSLMVRSVRPNIRLGVTTLAAYRKLPGYSAPSAYASGLQDPIQWLRNGYVDYVAPLLDVNERDGFTDYLSSWITAAEGSEILPMLSAASTDPSGEAWPLTTLTSQIATVRSESALKGLALDHSVNYCGESETASELYAILADDLFYFDAHVPATVWAGPSYPPENVVQSYENGRYTVSWNAPFGAPEPRYYAVYFADSRGRVDVENSDNLVRARVTENEFILDSDYAGLLFGVTAFNRGFSESEPVTADASGLDMVSTLSSRVVHWGTVVDIVSQQTIARVELYSLSGVKLRSIKIGDNAASISVGDYPRGIYIIKAIYGDSSSETYKIIR